MQKTLIVGVMSPRLLKMKADESHYGPSGVPGPDGQDSTPYLEKVKLRVMQGI
jgi:hypothetical protein